MNPSLRRGLTIFITLALGAGLGWLSGSVWTKNRAEQAFEKAFTANAAFVSKAMEAADSWSRTMNAENASLRKKVNELQEARRDTPLRVKIEEPVVSARQRVGGG